jgi:hypothetical protein
MATAAGSAARPAVRRPNQVPAQSETSSNYTNRAKLDRQTSRFCDGMIQLGASCLQRTTLSVTKAGFSGTSATSVQEALIWDAA